MSYFDKILNGNIPLSIIECINGYNNKYKIHKDYPYFQINADNEIEKDMNQIFDSYYGKYIKTSVNIKRKDIIDGVNNILKLSLEDININNSINYITNHFTNNFMNIINNLKISDYSKKILLLIIKLTGITNENYDDNKDELKLLLQLQKLKDNKQINIYESFKNKIPSLKRNNINYFDQEYIYKLADLFVSILEEILDNILKSINHDSICNFYAFTIEIAESLTKTIENFGLFLNENETNNTNVNKVTNEQDIKKNIDQSAVIKGMSKLLTSSITSAMNSNTSSIMSTIKAENQLKLSGVKGASFSLDGVNQSASSSSSTEATVTQSITSKITTAINNELTKNIKYAASNALDDSKAKTSDIKDGTNVGGTIGAIAGAAGSSVDNLVNKTADVLSLCSSTTTNNSTTNDTTNKLKSDFSLNSSFHVENNNDVSTQLKNLLDAKNIAKCGKDALSKNSVELSNIEVTGAVNISNISQNSVITDITKCIFNQTVINDIATKVVNQFNDTIANMSKNVDSKLDSVAIKKTTGDIEAIGVAGAAILEGAGKGYSSAVTGIGTALSTAATGVGTGVSSAATGVGTGVSSAATGIGTGASTAVQGLGTGLSTTAQGLGTGLSTTAQGIGSGVQNITTGLGSMFSSMMLPMFFLAIVAGVILYIKNPELINNLLNMI